MINDDFGDFDGFPNQDDQYTRLQQDLDAANDLLIQEQRTAVEQAEILTRTQIREVDLNEQIAEISRELEDREGQNESLLAAKKKLEGEIKALREQAAADSSSIDRLGKDKQLKESQLKQLESDLALESDRIRKLESDKKSVDAQLVALESRLAEADDGQASLLKLKAKLLAQISELEIKLEQEKDEKNRTEIKRASLDQEVTVAKTEIVDLKRLKTDLEQSIKKGESEISSLTDNLTLQGIEKDGIERQRRELTVKLQTVQESKLQAKEEVEVFKQKSAEVESQLVDLRCQKEVAENQLVSITAQSEQFQSEVNRLEREKQVFQRQADSLKDEIDQEVQKSQALENQKKRIGIELSDLQARLDDHLI